MCYDLAHQIRCAKHTLSGRVISHLWCAARLVGIAHHSFYSVPLNKKVGFKIPTTRYRKNSILCGALHSCTAKWTSGVGWSFGPLGV